ncbi:MAG: L-threonylcarbamoyladenylate synthase [Patescibacteria group bacterium]|jgi:L-threonylcarbamoyladenylate synthase
MIILAHGFSMETVKLGNSNAHKIMCRATEVIKSGGVIVYPTDTVYGLGCDPFNIKAVHRLLKIKRRSEQKGLLLLVNSWLQLRQVVKPTLKQLILLKQYWPGPLTVVLPKHRAVSTLVTGGRRTVAVRWPRHDFVSKCLNMLTYPIISTSANLSGQPPAYTIGKIKDQFQGKRYQPDLIIDAGRLPNRPPSTIIQFTSRKIAVVRQGALHIKEANA